VLATWDICSHNRRVAPVQSLSSPILTSSKDVQVRKLENRQASAQGTCIHHSHQPSREVTCSPRPWKKTGQETQKHPLTLTRPFCSAEEASLALGKHAFRDVYYTLVGMMQSTQHGHGDHLVRLMWWRSRKRRRVRNPLPDPLMWPSLIVVPDRDLGEAVELFLLQDQEMIQACSPDASQKAFVIWHWLAEFGMGCEVL
jgi:hypothetical protein